MGTSDFFALIHPILAVAVVFPIIGIVTHYAWQTRQRRLKTSGGGKSQIPPVVGREHVQLGRWLTGSVVGLSLIGLAYAIFEHILSEQIWSKSPTQVIFIVLMFAATITSLVFLYRARERKWRAIFATLTGIGIVVLGCQDGVFRRTNEWYWSHYYIGITATLLMVFSLAIVEDIYKDRSNRWRNIHIILNCFALLLFLGQGMTGSRDLLEIPLSWQKPTIYQCDFVNKTCPPLAPLTWQYGRGKLPDTKSDGN
jgi:drug/metabolite transporter (DMT)-like permease